MAFQNKLRENKEMKAGISYDLLEKCYYFFCAGNIFNTTAQHQNMGI